jgi:hypothetical protein
MEKGVYNQAFYVGDQIQLATDAPQLIENNQKLDELILKVDTNLDAKVSTRLADADYVEPDNTTIGQIKTKVDTLENADFTTTNTLIIDLGSPMQTGDAVVSDIKSKVDTLENYDDTETQTKLDTLQTTVDNIDVDFTPVLDAIDLTLKETDYTAPDNATIAEIQTKVDTLDNTDITPVLDAVEDNFEVTKIISVEVQKLN